MYGSAHKLYARLERELIQFVKMVVLYANFSAPTDSIPNMRPASGWRSYVGICVCNAAAIAYGFRIIHICKSQCSICGATLYPAKFIVVGFVCVCVCSMPLCAYIVCSLSTSIVHAAYAAFNILMGTVGVPIFHPIVINFFCCAWLHCTHHPPGPYNSLLCVHARYDDDD